jgi:hypothetical protein
VRTEEAAALLSPRLRPAMRSSEATPASGALPAKAGIAAEAAGTP